MNAKKIIDTARTLFTDDKGLLAMDESNPTCNGGAKMGGGLVARVVAPFGGAPNILDG